MQVTTLDRVGRLHSVTFTEGRIDRAAHRRSEADLLDRLLQDPRTHVIEMTQDRFGVDDRGRLLVRPPRPADSQAALRVFLGEREIAVTGEDRARDAYVLIVSDEDGSHGSSIGLRELVATLEADVAALVATSLGLANWHRTHPRCSLCGEPTEPAQAGWIRRCPADGSEHFPRTDIAVIMAVTDADDRLLLGRAPSWPPGRMSILAGFVEPGETLEQAVAREVFEEVGLRVGEVEFVADQPWPFPSSMMIGFTARAEGTELSLDQTELAEARWVRRDEVPGLIESGEYRPSPSFSISRALVEDWFGGPLPRRPRRDSASGERL